MKRMKLLPARGRTTCKAQPTSWTVSHAALQRPPGSQTRLHSSIHPLDEGDANAAVREGYGEDKDAAARNDAPNNSNEPLLKPLPPPPLAQQLPNRPPVLAMAMASTATRNFVRLCRFLLPQPC